MPQEDAVAYKGSSFNENAHVSHRTNERMAPLQRRA